jgi:hypothetical protein
MREIAHMVSLRRDILRVFQPAKPKIVRLIVG